MTTRHFTWAQSYIERSLLSDTLPLAAYLLRLIAIKRTTFAYPPTIKLLALAEEEVGDSIGLLKIHADTITGFNNCAVKLLHDIAKLKRFLLFEDEKFSDVGGMV